MNDTVTHEDVMRVARHQCSRWGHNYETVVAAGSDQPQYVVCGHCGKSWRMSSDQLIEAMEEARRCLTLIGHVARSQNTWATRCQAADAVLADAIVEQRGGDQPQAEPAKTAVVDVSESVRNLEGVRNDASSA